MNQQKFLNIISKYIRKLPHNEKEDILRDFNEHFLMAEAAGHTEEEAIKTLGNPHQIGKELAADYYMDRAESKQNISSIVHLMWTIIGMSFVNLFIVFIPFVMVATLIISGWGVSIGFIFSLILYLVNVIVYPEIFEKFELFSTFIITGGGILLAILMYYLTKFTSNLTIRYLKFNMNLFKTGESSK